MNDVINTAVSMVIGSMLLSFFVMTFSINLAYAARRWFDGLRSLSDV